MSTDYEALLTQVTEAALDYMGGLDDRPVFPSPEAIRALQNLNEALPEDPRDPARVVALLNNVAAPATVASTGGRYFGFVIGGCLPAPLAANWLATVWDQNAGLWTCSPASAEIEAIACRWLLDLLDLPRDAAAGLVTGATMASFSSLAAARATLYKRQGWDVAEMGLRDAPALKIVAGEEIHGSLTKSIRLLGFGRNDIIWVPTDDNGALKADALPDLDENTLVLLQAGNINSGAFDPIAEVCERARDTGAWVHVDGAFGLWARVSATRRHLAEGMELADSWAVDGHKWLNVPYDSAAFFCRDAQATEEVLTMDGTYLVKNAKAREPSHFTPELSRRARGLEIWAAIKSLGRSGIEEMIDRTCDHARTFAEELSAAGFEVLNEVVLNQVSLHYKDDETTQAIVDAVQREGTCFLSPSTWKGKRTLRISVCSWATTDADVAATVAALIAASRRFG